MPDLMFPELPTPRPLAPVPAVLVAHRRSLLAILELLSISIHQVINNPAHRDRVAELYRISRWIDNENWLRANLP